MSETLTERQRTLLHAMAEVDGLYFEEAGDHAMTTVASLKQRCLIEYAPVRQRKYKRVYRLTSYGWRVAGRKNSGQTD